MADTWNDWYGSSGPCCKWCRSLMCPFAAILLLVLPILATFAHSPVTAGWQSPGQANPWETCLVLYGYQDYAVSTIWWQIGMTFGFRTARMTIVSPVRSKTCGLLSISRQYGRYFRQPSLYPEGIRSCELQPLTIEHKLQVDAIYFRDPPLRHLGLFIVRNSVGCTAHFIFAQSSMVSACARNCISARSGIQSGGLAPCWNRCAIPWFIIHLFHLNMDAAIGGLKAQCSL